MRMLLKYSIVSDPVLISSPSLMRLIQAVYRLDLPRRAQLRLGVKVGTFAKEIVKSYRLIFPTVAVSDLPPRSRLRLEQYETFVRMLPTCSDVELGEIIRRLRMQDDISYILGAVTTESLLLPLNRPDAGNGLEASFSGDDQTFGLLKGTREEIRNRPLDAHSPLNNRPWTIVTDDQEFIEHLLSLYFSWQHSFFQSFPEKHFREDMAAGRTKYCSKILVNAICAAGCLLSSRPEARRDPNDSLTAGLDFFDEAMRLLNDIKVSTLTTTAALYIMSHVDGHRGRLSSLWMFCGRSSRMALDINLHLRTDKQHGEKGGSTDLHVEERARLHAFWGCFIGDQYVTVLSLSN